MTRVLNQRGLKRPDGRVELAQPMQREPEIVMQPGVAHARRLGLAKSLHCVREPRDAGEGVAEIIQHPRIVGAQCLGAQQVTNAVGTLVSQRADHAEQMQRIELARVARDQFNADPSRFGEVAGGVMTGGVLDRHAYPGRGLPARRSAMVARVVI